MKRQLTFAAALQLSAALNAQEYRAEKLSEPPPADALAPELVQTLETSGVRVFKGQTPLVDLWLRKEWPAKAGFQPSSAVLYPFEMGDLLGVARYKSRASDFRQQEIPAGVYTVRYAQQPEDGNHLGTSDTRDFLLLIPATADRQAAKLAPPKLFEASAKAAGTTHPTMLSMLPSATGETPAIALNEERELVGVRVKGQANAGGKAAPLAVTIVVVGHAAE
jgi:hypothetical protein